MSLDDTIAVIDAVTDGCQQCGKPRGDSPSDDFCSEDCQEAWAGGGSDTAESDDAVDITALVQFGISTEAAAGALERLREDVARLSTTCVRRGRR